MNQHTRDFVMVEQSSLRQRMEAAIESMLALLDELDGDPNLEPDGDGLEEDDPGEDEGDREWSLGATAEADQSIGWAAHAVGGDLEEDDHDREHTALERHGGGFLRSADDDDEDGRDAEWDQAEAGIGDRDGLIEQCGSDPFLRLTIGAAI